MPLWWGQCVSSEGAPGAGRASQGQSAAASGAERARHARQPNPVGGWPPQFMHRVVSCRAAASSKHTKA
jgi:hypothetical protein